ncbi:hypothetical protein FOZ60_009616 [Perkinsus olseni]|uniref:Uncharacterized protein n=1 Tax=Perkinsus olseni TaxID=32597 RepID=A0A7J6NGY8_PEROL|nr:hypothetical protein FOZ60_009616 [Perkinsus olseni]
MSTDEVSVLADPLLTKYPGWVRETRDDGQYARCPKCGRLIKISKKSLTGVKYHQDTCGKRKRSDPTKTGNKDNQAECREALYQFVAHSGVPLCTVENEYFKHLLRCLNPHFEVPSRRDLVRQLRGRVANHVKIVQERLEGVSQISLSIDAWSRSSRSSFLCITAHFVKADKVNRQIVDFRRIQGRHTASNLAGELMDTITEAEIGDRICSVTSDAASVNIKMMKLIEHQPGSIIHVLRKETCRKS